MRIDLCECGSCRVHQSHPDQRCASPATFWAIGTVEVEETTEISLCCECLETHQAFKQPGQVIEYRLIPVKAATGA